MAFFKDLYWEFGTYIISYIYQLRRSSGLLKPMSVWLMLLAVSRVLIRRTLPQFKIVSIHTSVDITVYLKLADVGLSSFHKKAPKIHIDIPTSSVMTVRQIGYVNTLPVANIFTMGRNYFGTEL